TPLWPQGHQRLAESIGAVSQPQAGPHLVMAQGLPSIGLGNPPLDFCEEIQPLHRIFHGRVRRKMLGDVLDEVLRTRVCHMHLKIAKPPQPPPLPRLSPRWLTNRA